MKPFRYVLGLLAVLSLTSFAGAQNDPAFFERPKTPDQFWRAAQFELSIGNLELSAQYLQGFLASNPSDADIIAIIEKGNLDPRGDRKGLIPFIQLRNVPRWYDDRKKDDEAKANVEKVITLVTASLKKHYGDVKRIQRFIANLVATPEEAEFAANELLKAGRDAVPHLLQTLAQKPTDEMRSAVLDVLRSFDIDSVPAILAFLDGNTDTLNRVQLLSVLRNRTDFRQLMTRVDTDPRPTLWYFAGTPDGTNAILRNTARELLSILLGSDSEKQSPVDQLIQLASLLADGKGTYPDPKSVAIWSYDATIGMVLPPGTPITQSQAEEIFGLKYLRWALQLKPESIPARELFLSLAADKSYLRHGMDTPIAIGNPALYELISKTPTPILLSVFRKSLESKNPRIAFAFTQFMADRVDQNAESFELLTKALYFKEDPRVAFAAAMAIARIPNPPAHTHHTKVVDVLRSNLDVPNPKSDAAKPTAILLDHEPLRIRTTTMLLNRIGYRSEVVRTGSELLQRLRLRNDVSLVLVDRHTFSPPLIDLLPTLRSDPRCSALPVFIIATTDQAIELDLSALLLRLVLLVSVTDEIAPDLIKPKQFDDPRDGESKNIVPDLDRYSRIIDVLDERVERVMRLIAAQEIPVDARLRDRVRMFCLLVGSLDIDLPPTQKDQLTKLSNFFSTVPNPTQDEKIYRDRMVQLVSRIEQELSDEKLAKLNAYRLAVGGTRAVGRLPSARSEDLERDLAKTARPYRNVHVIPESFSEQALIANLSAAPEILQLVKNGEVLQLDQIVATIQEQGQQATTVRQRRSALALSGLQLLSHGALPGYDLRPIEAAIRSQLQSSDLAQVERAIEIVVTIPTKEAQQDLLNVVLRTDLPIPLRTLAAQSTLRHLSLIGKQISPAQVVALQAILPATREPLLRSLMNNLIGQLSLPREVSQGAFQAYTPSAPAAAAAPKAPMAAPMMKDDQ
ncbi:response regulator [Tuwongella immobilis]|uniref:Histidine kinase: HEAT repeat-containing protein n=1 Tax=Tuwongella immobilis TaxID=692036 RepID=A0A6C2YLJ5_9BACT|nr:hypothetical protein [Tuwongella immobilis]VIP02438.1 histidine kinase : HEAT repeat-containing protein OS=Singulisphaera acidiphila (strain ATCC BAA-1392 / DSM 18658 / VKM B-2454 / MOB10) GN=Sinac_0176 PE=4 SV=1 [Tuwongella immobilis]VTS01398.1 histidine kinase : HEAT repeat-containing protein OS=Singulisphaera acidiphila (strain ATCC BAA-1392 / DSM 18658 / VKM B-2454 / MOB10) GN=Sinac_0176 PE=4 SV=1 [Tuwongella immobilis]